MLEQTEGSSRRERTATYWIAAGILVLLAVTALFTFSAARSTVQARDKADELIAGLESAGAAALPSQEQVVGVLGDDGGAVCEDPASGLHQAILHDQLTNGAAGPGMRPVIADNKALAGELLVVKIYCPQHLEDVQQVVDDLKTDDVVKE
jgi:hypothetical protein